jgi:hypothetical protein
VAVGVSSARRPATLTGIGPADVPRSRAHARRSGREACAGGRAWPRSVAAASGADSRRAGARRSDPLPGVARTPFHVERRGDVEVLASHQTAPTRHPRRLGSPCSVGGGCRPSAAPSGRQRCVYTQRGTNEGPGRSTRQGALDREPTRAGRGEARGDPCDRPTYRPIISLLRDGIGAERSATVRAHPSSGDQGAREIHLAEVAPAALALFHVEHERSGVPRGTCPMRAATLAARPPGRVGPRMHRAARAAWGEPTGVVGITERAGDDGVGSMRSCTSRSGEREARSARPLRRKAPQPGWCSRALASAR